MRTSKHRHFWKQENVRKHQHFSVCWIRRQMGIDSLTRCLCISLSCARFCATAKPPLVSEEGSLTGQRTPSSCLSFSSSHIWIESGRWGFWSTEENRITLVAASQWLWATACWHITCTNREVITNKCLLFLILDRPNWLAWSILSVKSFDNVSSDLTNLLQRWWDQRLHWSTTQPQTWDNHIDFERKLTV